MHDEWSMPVYATVYELLDLFERLDTIRQVGYSIFRWRGRHVQVIRLHESRIDPTAVWRSSTPEPSRGDGIIWTYIKDITRYIPLLSETGTLQLELDNLLESTPQLLDGEYDG